MEDARVARESSRDRVRKRCEHDREREPDHDRPLDHARCRRVRAVGVAGPEHPAHDHLAGDRDRIEDQGEEQEELVRDLVRADLRVAHAREDGGGDEERGVERRCADEDLRRDCASGRRSSTTNAIPIPACAIAVPAAEPAIPQWKP